MPISAQYAWKDKKDTVKVLIPTKGVSPSKIDIYVTSSTLKVNMSPYLVDIVLAHPIDPMKHKASVINGVLNITLIKQTVGEWKELELSDEMASEVRKDAEEKQSLLEQEMQEKRRDKKIELERFALRKQMSLDEADRSRMDTVKADEKREAEAEVYATFAKMEAAKVAQSNGKPNVPSAVKSVQFKDSSDTTVSSMAPGKAPSSSKDIFTDDDCVVVDIDDFIASDDVEIDEDSDNGAPTTKAAPSITDIDADDYAYVQVEDDEVKFVPAPRTAGVSSCSDAKVQIQFSTRVFPTPLRESKIAEEEDWVAKNRKHLKKHGVLGKAVPKGKTGDISEEDPIWLKAKGDDFFRSGDFRSAVNAYSAAIDIDDEAIACYSNRSACYLKLNMSVDCVEDCSTALQLLLVEATANAALASTDTALALPSNGAVHARQRSKLLIRRAAAYCQMGKFTSSVEDYQTALMELRLLSSSMELERSRLGVAGLTPAAVDLEKEKNDVAADLKKMELLRDVDALKQQGDALFAERLLAEARGKYDEALSLLPFHVSCLSNRSACRFATGDITGCVEDCTTALAILEIDISKLDPTSSSTQFDAVAGGGDVLGAVASAAMLSSILPAAGSDKRKSWVLKTATRRGAALAQLGRFDEAILDYSLAAALDPRNDSLRVDLNRIMNFKSGANQTGSNAKQPLIPSPAAVTASSCHDHDGSCTHD